MDNCILSKLKRVYRRTLRFSNAEAAIRLPAGGVDVASAGGERNVPARAPQPAAVRPLPDAELGVVGLRQPREDEDRRPGAADADGAAAWSGQDGRRCGRSVGRGTQTRFYRVNQPLRKDSGLKFSSQLLSNLIINPVNACARLNSSHFEVLMALPIPGGRH